MLYQCKACGYQAGRGCLPAVTCGLYTRGFGLQQCHHCSIATNT